ncbi:DNA-binding protein [Zhaonella formicivorans]|jgi:hypothetical protein|uniref:DNA-binding protein n=1 Tax=Zhaonella formicivorans TaxID=2528593 RepID=UPI0010E8B734|nr:DNA-binding protein [Zhaonella formicivorans]
MAKEVLPMRFRVLHYAAQKKDSFSYHDILKDLKDEYGGEGQFNKGMAQLHLDSLRAVGMLEIADAELDANNELVIKYKITDYGMDRLKYLPDAWKKIS